VVLRTRPSKQAGNVVDSCAMLHHDRAYSLLPLGGVGALSPLKSFGHVAQKCAVI
jgi:hypothetical protein